MAVGVVDPEVGLIEAVIKQARHDLKSRDVLTSFDGLLFWLYSAGDFFRSCGLDLTDQELIEGVVLEGRTNGKTRAN